MNPNYPSYLMQNSPLRNTTGLQTITTGPIGGVPPSYFNDPTAAAGMLGGYQVPQQPPNMQVPPWMRKKGRWIGGRFVFDPSYLSNMPITYRLG